MLGLTLLTEALLFTLLKMSSHLTVTDFLWVQLRSLSNRELIFLDLNSQKLGYNVLKYIK